MNATLNISADKYILREIKDGYANDPWCMKLPSATHSWPELRLEDGLWYVGERLIIPRTGSLHEILFQLAHDSLGHFGFDKSYGLLCSAYYWPNMRQDLEKVMWHHVRNANGTSRQPRSLSALYTPSPSLTSGVTLLPSTSSDHFWKMKEITASSLVLTVWVVISNLQPHEQTSLQRN